MRNFEIGDEVEFEIIYIKGGTKWRPRWNFGADNISSHNKDQGPTRLAVGKVKSAGKKSFVVKPLDPNIQTWGWNQPDQQQDTSYGSSGYLRLINSEAVSLRKQENNICTCPIQDLWNFGCRCGGGK